MKAAVTIAVWLVWISGMVAIKKISPDTFRTYAVYGACICGIFTVGAVTGAI